MSIGSLSKLNHHAYFSREVWASAKTAHKSSYLDIDKPNLSISIQALHEKLEKNGLLLDKDIKGKCITM
jgi:hypothetical protein